MRVAQTNRSITSFVRPSLFLYDFIDALGSLAVQLGVHAIIPYRAEQGSIME